MATRSGGYWPLGAYSVTSVTGKPKLGHLICSNGWLRILRNCNFQYLAIADRPDGFLRVVLDDGSLKSNVDIRSCSIHFQNFGQTCNNQVHATVKSLIHNSDCDQFFQRFLTWWTKTSSLVSFLLMNPYPDLTLNHFTVPLTLRLQLINFFHKLIESKSQAHLGGDHLLYRLLLLFHLQIE